MAGSRSLRREICWWAGVAAWAALAALWRPEPPPTYLDTPSASADPGGYAVFHDMVARSAAAARRTLAGVAQLGDEVGVLVVLSPSLGIDADDREALLDWASSSGGTLIVGYPLRDERGEIVSRLSEEGLWEVSAWKEAKGGSAEFNYMPRRVDEPRSVPAFALAPRGEMELSGMGAEAMAADADGRVAASIEQYGAGTLIQIADAAVLDNAALGFKRTHLFAAALIDEVGRDKIWVFDESHEGVDPEPSLVAYLGSGPWRSVLLGVLLLGLFVYWWASARLARPVPAPPSRRAREVATLARDVGDFYFRAGRSEWALSRVLEHLRRTLKSRGTGSAERLAAEEVCGEAAQELATDRRGAERHLYLIRKMAICQRMLAESSKGKKR